MQWIARSAKTIESILRLIEIKGIVRYTICGRGIKIITDLQYVLLFLNSWFHSFLLHIDCIHHITRQIKSWGNLFILAKSACFSELYTILKVDSIIRNANTYPIRGAKNKDCSLYISYYPISSSRIRRKSGVFCSESRCLISTNKRITGFLSQYASIDTLRF